MEYSQCDFDTTFSTSITKVTFQKDTLHLYLQVASSPQENGKFALSIQGYIHYESEVYEIWLTAPTEWEIR